MYYAAPNTFDPIVGNLYPSNESSNISNSNHSIVKNVDNKTSPNQGYSEVTLAGLKLYVQSNYSNFTNITNNTSLINNLSLINNTNETSQTNITNFNNENIDNNTNNTNITNITNIINDLSNSSNNTNLVYYIESNDSVRLFAGNGSFDIIVTNNSSVEESVDINNSEFATNNSSVEESVDMNNSEFATNNSNVTSVVTLGNNLTIVHYNQYFEESYIGEMTWVYFKVDDKDVSVGWAGNNVDMYVVDSFFNLN